MRMNNMYRMVFFLLLGAIFCTGVRGQDTKPEPCPDVKVFGPATEVQPNESGKFRIVVDYKGFYRPISISWSAIGGEIVSGMEETEVTVRRKSKEDFDVYATVTGFRPRCERTFAEDRPDLTVPETVFLDTFEKMVSESDKDRLLRIVGDIKGQRNHELFIVLRYDKDRPSNSARSWRDALLTGLTNAGIGYHTFMTFIDVPADSDSLEIWRVTRGAKPPID